MAPPDGPSQHWQASGYDQHARFVSDYGAGVLDWLNPQTDDIILDLGCGDGALTEQLLGRAARVVAADGSADMVRAARARGLDARVADGEALDFSGEFSAVFSNAALHWMRRPEAVVAGVWQALQPRGRFVAEMGGAGNVQRIVTTLHRLLRERGHTPPPVWYFPTPAEYAAVLERQGFTVRRLALFDRPTPLPTGTEGWLLTFAAPLLAGLPESEVAELRREAAAELDRALDQDPSGRPLADYVRLRFEAVRPLYEDEYSADKHRPDKRKHRQATSAGA